MPVTAKLSKAFYDSVGERAANELVDWFNAVDATYRADLKELNELNFARFDAKLELRIAGLAAEMRAGFAAQDAKLATLEAKLERRFGDQTRFLYLAWATVLAAIIGVGLR